MIIMACSNPFTCTKLATHFDNTNPYKLYRSASSFACYQCDSRLVSFCLFCWIFAVGKENRRKLLLVPISVCLDGHEHQNSLRVSVLVAFRQLVYRYHAEFSYFYEIFIEKPLARHCISSTLYCRSTPHSCNRIFHTRDNFGYDCLGHRAWGYFLFRLPWRENQHRIETFLLTLKEPS